MRPALVTFTAALALALTATAGASTTCANTFGGDVIAATGIPCKQARKVVRAWGHGIQRGKPVDHRARGFDCKGSDSSVEGLVMRCRRGDARVRFYANVPPA